MFKEITWGQYAFWLLLALAIYYAYVGLAFYRVELLGLLRNRGKVTSSASALEVVPAALASTGKRSLIAKPALTAPTAPTNAPTVLNEETQPDENKLGKELLIEADHQEKQHADDLLEPVADLPPFELTTAEPIVVINYENEIENIFDNDNLINFTKHNGSKSFLDAESMMESANDDFYLGSTIGIAQLGDYLTSAAEGQVTPAQLVEQEPGLANTDLLLAFFQTSTKSAQRATAHLYEGITEPALD